jgi:ankyrin repeat protein
MKQLMDAPRRKAHVARLVRVGAIWASLATAGCRSIHEAARDGDVAAVEKMLARGCDPNARSWRNSRPLLEAASGGHLDVVKLLVEKGADVNQQGDCWLAPLHLAAHNGHVEVVCYLLEHGADVSLFGHDKPLHMAVRGGHVNIARILLEHKADVNAKGMDGATALDVASESGLADMAAFLLKSGAVRTQRGEHAE